MVTGQFAAPGEEKEQERRQHGCDAASEAKEEGKGVLAEAARDDDGSGDGEKGSEEREEAGESCGDGWSGGRGQRSRVIKSVLHKADLLGREVLRI